MRPYYQLLGTSLAFLAASHVTDGNPAVVIAGMFVIGWLVWRLLDEPEPLAEYRYPGGDR